MTMEEEQILPVGETVDTEFDKTVANVGSSINFDAIEKAKIDRKMTTTGWYVA